MKVTYNVAATRDVTRAADYFRDEAGETVANRILRRVEEKVRLLQDHPGAGYATSRPNVRRILIAEFPYQILYRILGQKELRIVRIRHAHRRPLSWL